MPVPLPRVLLAGAVGGLLSGLFGVGGGIVMVPIFVLWLGLDQKRAITTSLIAIIPISVFGMLGYAIGGAVDWGVGIALGVGSIAGGQLGSWLLPRVPVPWLQALFALLLGYSAYRLVFPSDLAPVAAGSSPATWALLVAVGVVAGTVAGLLGVGGGIILVPALVLLAGANLDVARGTSLMVVLFTAATATITNVRHDRADPRIGWWAGIAGAPAALVASFLGQWLPERQAAVLFAALMVIAAVQLLRKAVTGWRSVAASASTPAALD